MIEREAIIATTHVDSEGDKLAIEALHSLVDSICSSYIPIWNEHDPRHPPIGRIATAKVRERDDGEHEVVALLESFDGSEPEQYLARMFHKPPSRSPGTAFATIFKPNDAAISGKWDVTIAWRGQFFRSNGRFADFRRAKASGQCQIIVFREWLVSGWRWRSGQVQ